MSSQQTYKCGSCDKTRNSLRFSNTAIKKYEESLRKSRRTGSKFDIKLPRCQDCSGQQRHELECAQCGVVKGLDAFSKQMRRNPDNAECIDCVQEREDREPDHRIETEEQEIIERLRNGVPPTAYGSGRSMMGYSHQSNVLSNSRGLNAFSNTDEDEWIQPPVEVPEDPRNKLSGQGDITNLQGRMRRLSMNSNDTQETYQSDVTKKTTGSQWENFDKKYATYREQVHSVSGRGSSVGSNATQGGNPGFVKQGAVKLDRLTKAQIQLERERRRKQEQEEQKIIAGSDSDDDDDSDDDPANKYGF